MIELKAKIGSRGQIVIPKPIRDMLKMQAGESVFFRVSNGEVVVRKGHGIKVLKRMVNRVKDKKKEPKKIDWDKEYYSQFDQ